MKFLISSVFLVFLFSANASEITTTEATSSASQTTIQFYPGNGKKKRKNKRTNKRRKRKCHKWARKSYAG